MNSIQFARLAAGVAAISLVAAGSASAQAAAQPGTNPKSGPPINGVCVMSQQRALLGSAAGQGVAARMKQLEQQVQAELTPEATSIQNDVKAYQAQAASLTPDARKAKEVSLQQRAEAFQRKQQLRSRELEATQNKALNRIIADLNPVARTVYESRNCAMLVDQQAVIFTNPTMDITDTVISQLNGKLAAFSFEREHLDQAAAPAPAAKKN